MIKWCEQTPNEFDENFKEKLETQEKVLMQKKLNILDNLTTWCGNYSNGDLTSNYHLSSTVNYCNTESKIPVLRGSCIIDCLTSLFLLKNMSFTFDKLYHTPLWTGKDTFQISDLYLLFDILKDPIKYYDSKHLHIILRLLCFEGFMKCSVSEKTFSFVSDQGFQEL